MGALFKGRGMRLSDGAASVIGGLLQEDEASRLGCERVGGPTALRAHAWFGGVQWDALLQRSLRPPSMHISSRDIRRPAERGAPYHVTKLGKPTPPYVTWEFKP
mmetsp:Transcript_8679/g.20840  ORF Transcript_8679/g.20840 Transcript_8679/m.20840 type:complete len:104 (-) Transcript_8679:237-548(-)